MGPLASAPGAPAVSPAVGGIARRHVSFGDFWVCGFVATVYLHLIQHIFFPIHTVPSTTVRGSSGGAR